jgi:hypothetical protein
MDRIKTNNIPKTNEPAIEKTMSEPRMLCPHILPIGGTGPSQPNHKIKKAIQIPPKMIAKPLANDLSIARCALNLI